ncbi:MAG: hypothetical protein ABIH23_19510 [bacterium]
MTTPTKLKANCLYRLRDNRYHGHCRHGLVIVKENCGTLIAVDTYWGGSGGSDNTMYPPESVEEFAEFVMDMTHAKQVDERTWRQYADKDRGFIPTGGGSEKWLVDSRAKPVVEQQLDQLRYEISRCEDRIRHEAWSIQSKADEIEKLVEAQDAKREVRLSGNAGAFRDSMQP